MSSKHSFFCACKSQDTCVQLHHLQNPISILVLPFLLCSQGHSQEPHGGKNRRILSVREAIFELYIFRQRFILSEKAKQLETSLALQSELKFPSTIQFHGFTVPPVIVEPQLAHKYHTAPRSSQPPGGVGRAIGKVKTHELR